MKLNFAFLANCAALFTGITQQMLLCRLLNNGILKKNYLLKKRSTKDGFMWKKQLMQLLHSIATSSFNTSKVLGS